MKVDTNQLNNILFKNNLVLYNIVTNKLINGVDKLDDNKLIIYIQLQSKLEESINGYIRGINTSEMYNKY
jgi:hypothetical protein